MQHEPQGGESILGVEERRARPRLQATSLILVNLDDLNGGVVFNISEDGLALSAAQILPEGQLPTMRIQFPGSSDWILANGRIAWKSKSKKEAGVQFVGLTEDARQRIREWISCSLSRSESFLESKTMHEEQPLAASVNDRSNSRTPAPASLDLFTEEQIQSIGAPANLAFSLESKEAAGATLDQRQGSFRGPAHPVPTSPPADRRGCPRKRIIPLGYLQLGQGNGGIAVNVSESGIAIAAAVPLSDDHLPIVRFQFPDSEDWIEASGQIAWRSDSNKEAGVRFVGLTQDALQKIRDWISSQDSLADDQEQAGKIWESQDRPSENPLVPQPGNPVYGTSHSGEAPEKHSDESIFSPVASLTSTDSAPPTANLRAYTPARKLPDQTAAPLTAELVHGQTRPEAWRSRWGATATLAALVGLVSMALGMIAMRSDVRKAVLAVSGQKTEGWNRTPKEEASSPKNKIPSVPVASTQRVSEQVDSEEPQLAKKNESLRDAPLRNPRQQTRVPERPSIRPIIETPSHPVQKPQPQTDAGLVSVPPQLDDRIAASANSGPSPLKDALLTDLKNNRGPLPVPKQPEIPKNVKGSVAIVTDPYPSLRMSSEGGLKKSRRGTSLQFGHLNNRVEPIYPEEAKQQGIEGTVTLHVIIARNGTVESLSSINGPPLLARAAAGAVQQWRYTETVLAGKSVETEEDVAITFRLSNAPAPGK